LKSQKMNILLKWFVQHVPQKEAFIELCRYWRSCFRYIILYINLEEDTEFYLKSWESYHKCKSGSHVSFLVHIKFKNPEELFEFQFRYINIFNKIIWLTMYKNTGWSLLKIKVCTIIVQFFNGINILVFKNKILSRDNTISKNLNLNKFLNKG